MHLSLTFPPLRVKSCHICFHLYIQPAEENCWHLHLVQSLGEARFANSCSLCLHHHYKLVAFFCEQHKQWISLLLLQKSGKQRNDNLIFALIFKQRAWRVK